MVGIEKKNGSVQYAGGIAAPAAGLYANLNDGAYRVGFRAHQLEIKPLGFRQIAGLVERESLAQ